MSEKGERTCPLCAEEMDLTDQQLKPCKCGYEICVWCWHHIMDMAEKDDSEGRCPACRNPYNKEKIVGMAANCERLVAEINMEKKIKSQKAKTKTCEERKQLSSVRVIQRNLVYIVGLPLNLADEDLLSRKEYFGQYGKVLKVSISRTAAGAIQHFPNNTCSVYISYLKEDEAVRCIQSVHGFILDDRPLRACFGTTKYCHAWLRNMSCNNPDCLYLHEIGSQEDSFTKDEIISAYTRSRVQQIAGVTCNLHDRSGNVLPPPIDEYYSNNSTSMGKPTVKNISNASLSTNAASIVKVSTPDGSCSGSVALPAAASWGARPSSGHTSSSNVSWANEHSKQKLVTLSGSLPSSSTSGSPSMFSNLHSDIGKKILQNEDALILQNKDKREMDFVKAYQAMTLQNKASETPVTSSGSSVSLTSPGRPLCRPPPPSIDDYSSISLHDLDSRKGISSILSSRSFDKLPGQSSGFDRANCLVSNHAFTNSHGTGLQSIQNYYAEQQKEPLASLADAKAATTVNISGLSREQCDWNLDSSSKLVQGAYAEEQSIAYSFGDKRFDDSVVTNNTTLHNSSDLLNCSRDQYLRYNNGYAYNLNPVIVDKKSSQELPPIHASNLLSISSNGFSENPAGFYRTAESPHMLSNEGKMQLMSCASGESSNIGSSGVTELGEDSIISNILSMDFDPWDESLASSQNFAKMLGETNERNGSLKNPNSKKVQNSDQSRFSFARQEEARNLLFDVSPISNQSTEVPRNTLYNHNIGGREDLQLKRVGNDNVFASSFVNDSDKFLSSHPALSSNPSVSRAQVSVPPGFSIPSRAPPPGFFSQDRMEPQIFNPVTGKQVVELRNHYQVHENVNMNMNMNMNMVGGDIEFIDPAILAVGKGRFPQQQEQQLRSVFENEARLQQQQQHLMLQNHHHQTLRYPAEFGASNPNVNTVFPQFSLQQQQQQHNGLMSNTHHLDGWNEIHNGNNLGELMRNNKVIYGGDPKYQMPTSGDFYNRRSFGI